MIKNEEFLIEMSAKKRTKHVIICAVVFRCLVTCMQKSDYFHNANPQIILQYCKNYCYNFIF